MRAFPLNGGTIWRLSKPDYLGIVNELFTRKIPPCGENGGCKSDERESYRIPVPGLGQKQGYGWNCPSQQTKNDCALAVGDKIFVVKRIVNNPANTPSLRSRRAVLFINIVPFCLVGRNAQETQVIQSQPRCAGKNSNRFAEDRQGRNGKSYDGAGRGS